MGSRLGISHLATQQMTTPIRSCLTSRWATRIAMPQDGVARHGMRRPTRGLGFLSGPSSFP